MQPSQELLERLERISRELGALAGNPAEYELDPDAVAELNLARQPVDDLIRRVKRLLE